MPKKSTAVGHAGKDFDCTILGDVFTDVIMRVNGDYRHVFRGGTSYCDFAKVVSENQETSPSVCHHTRARQPN